MEHADETPCQVLKEDGKTAQSRSYMWLYGSGNDGLPVYDTLNLPKKSVRIP